MPSACVLGARWVEAAGGRVRLGKGGEGVEVSPRVSYSGEGLAPLCRGRTLRAAHDPFLQVRCGPGACPGQQSIRHPGYMVAMELEVDLLAGGLLVLYRLPACKPACRRVSSGPM